ncbi:hypothetical protein DLAC_08367 [Tieghemostelium lacteum]|uniref:Uncharacterized protein n=1 Tax=Tieghemostelium lacteum TaxID=361077 RepID=A0A151ZC00_TIELA|nr:hypothetical protein DLAC_08367 [Tieghemostelium lacteum]|eukprot:KYQ91404.1 hypothetical protein DLAC_08367 [Tieghemostelium lacteum]
MNIDNNNTQPTIFNDIDIPKEHWNNESVRKWCKVIGIPENDILIISKHELDGFWLIFKHTSGNLEKELNDLGVSLPSSARILAKFIPPTQGTFVGKWESTQDLLKWMINRYGAPKPPANETGTEMPLMGRDMVLQDIYTKILTRYQIPNRHRDNQPLLVVAGAPGIGKTRILETIGNYLHTKKDSQLPKYQININISLGNGSNWDPYSESSNPNIALCKRVLWRYFANGHHVPFIGFCREINSMLKETTTLDFCFSAINDHLASLDPTMQQQQQILINFGIDEFQKCLIESKDVVQRRSILKAVIQSVSDLLVFLPNTRFFYNIIFSGTILEDITIIIGGYSIPYDFIPLRLLNLDEYMKISETILGTQKSNDNDIQRAIRFMGGWPRPLEILFKVVRNLTLIKYDTSNLLNRVELELNKRYPITSIEDLLPSIIVYSVTQTVIRPQDKPQMVTLPQDKLQMVIRPQDTPQPYERSFGDLQSFGFLTITSDNKVFLPLIFLRRYTYLNNKSSLLKSLHYLIQLLEKKSSWEEWENFNCHLEIIKHQSYHSLSLMNESKSYSLREYYKSALFFPPILADSTFSTKVDTLSICSFPTSRCPENCDIDQQCQDGTAIIKNDKGGLVDMFYNAKLDIGTAYFLGNVKYTDGSTATLKTKDLDLTNYGIASEHIVKKTSNKQQIKFIPIVYSNHFVTALMKNNFNDQLKKIIKITEAIIVCRGTRDNNNVPQPHDGFYYPFQDFIYKLEESV